MNAQLMLKAVDPSHSFTGSSAESAASAAASAAPVDNSVKGSKSPLLDSPDRSAQCHCKCDYWLGVTQQLATTQRTRCHECCEARSDGHILVQQRPLRGTVKATTVATASMALTATMPEKEALLAETVVDRLGR